MKHSKNWRASREKINRLQEYSLIEAIDILKSTSFVKFDESVDIAVNLGVDPRKSDQVVRSAVVLPNGLGKTVSVMAFAQGAKVKEAEEAGADYAGGEDFAEKIKNGWLEFDATVATPDMMKVVGKLGKILGTRGLMPNPKLGTVTMEIGKAVKELKAGKAKFRVEKGGILHASVGKLSFPSEHLQENIKTFMEAVYKAKPAAAKGTYVKKVSLSSSMGQGIKVKVLDLKL
ncbi:MAG: 50S ribosomal protein L1 [Chitinispirillia bacterium]|jgi:large subunit ribosomal protein L1